nr:hypothetical protein CFP56_71440 [Quercus suber]
MVQPSLFSPSGSDVHPTMRHTNSSTHGFQHRHSRAVHQLAPGSAIALQCRCGVEEPRGEAANAAQETRLSRGHAAQLAADIHDPSSVQEQGRSPGCPLRRLEPVLTRGLDPRQVYFMWDFMGRTLAMLLSVPPALEGLTSPQQETWNDVVGRSVMGAGLILDEKPGMLAQMMQMSYPGVADVDVGDDVLEAARALKSDETLHRWVRLTVGTPSFATNLASLTSLVRHEFELAEVHTTDAGSAPRDRATKGHPE